MNKFNKEAAKNADAQFLREETLARHIEQGYKNHPVAKKVAQWVGGYHMLGEDSPHICATLRQLYALLYDDIVKSLRETKAVRLAEISAMTLMDFTTVGDFTEEDFLVRYANPEMIYGDEAPSLSVASKHEYEDSMLKFTVVCIVCYAYDLMYQKGFRAEFEREREQEHLLDRAHHNMVHGVPGV